MRITTLTLALLSLSLTQIALATPHLSDANLLSGLAATPANINVSTELNATYSRDNSTDGVGGGANAEFCV